MIFNLSKLKEESIEFESRLRFPIDALEVEIDGVWKEFRELKGVYETERGRKPHLGLRDVLVDTGNEANYFLVAGHFLKDFSNRFIKLEYKSGKVSNIKGNSLRIGISSKRLRMRLFNVIFYSKIGFRLDIDNENINTVNIGIDCIKQFINIIFNDGISNYYYCANC